MNSVCNHKTGYSRTSSQLHGVPILAKDIFITLDKMATTGEQSI
jgi:Asp-tRNA(Asn)/Glu-tRNA(Gln) amidotransferase A subunit family amidase